MAKVNITVEATTDAYEPEETAELRGRGIATIWRWIRDGKILVVRVGGRTLIPERNRKAKERARLTRPINR